jgi:hypothetical protein
MHRPIAPERLSEAVERDAAMGSPRVTGTKGLIELKLQVLVNYGSHSRERSPVEGSACVWLLIFSPDELSLRSVICSKMLAALGQSHTCTLPGFFS